jgi:hypothetical protein
MKKLLFILLIIFLTGCKKITYCWECESKAIKVEVFTICDKTEPEIRQFEKSYTHPGPLLTTMKCHLKIN